MNKRRKRITHDNINKAIITELLKDANVRNKDLFKRLKIPLSTVQRRTKALESSSLIKKRFHIDMSLLGLRRGDIIIGVNKGKTKQVSNR